MKKEEFPFCKRQNIDHLIFELGVDREQLLLWLRQMEEPEWSKQEAAIDVLFRLLRQINEHVLALQDEWATFQ